MVEHAEGDVACAAGDVEDCLSSRTLGAGSGGGGESDTRIERANEMVFPETVDAEGHEVVHGVVGGGDGGEDGGDWRSELAIGRKGVTRVVKTSGGFLRLVDGLEAEVRCSFVGGFLRSGLLRKAQGAGEASVGLPRSQTTICKPV